MRTDTLAIVFTDLKGYTATTSHQTHQQNARMLRRIERIVRPVVVGFNGRVIKSIGDAYMIVFRSPTEAVRCSTAIQDRLHQHNTTSSADKAIHLRIAMNIGEVRVHRGDVFGEPVNIAARLEGVTPADEIYISEALYLTMNRSDLPTEVVGEFELKGIPEPVSVHKVKKFAHLEEDDEPAADGDAELQKQTEHAVGLPFGGTQLSHWRRLRWLRRFYVSLWVLAIFGIAGAAYLRYRPSSDFSEQVARAQAAAEAKDPMGIIGAAGEIPRLATEERAAVRRYRRLAVEMLLQKGDVDTASGEIDSLLGEDDRDAEVLMLRGLLRHTQGDLKAAVADLEEALTLKPDLATKREMIEILIAGYDRFATRNTVDGLIGDAIKKAAVPALAEAVNGLKISDRKGRYLAAERLRKLGAGDEVDWVVLAIEDLKSTSCKVRRGAIAKLISEGDDRAVGPLIKVAESKGCYAKQAKAAADTIVK